MSERIERLTLQRDKLDNQISQLMIQQQREQQQQQQQQSQITKHADVRYYTLRVVIKCLRIKFKVDLTVGQQQLIFQDSLKGWPDRGAYATNSGFFCGPGGYHTFSTMFFDMHQFYSKF